MTFFGNGGILGRFFSLNWKSSGVWPFFLFKCMNWRDYRIFKREAEECLKLLDVQPGSGFNSLFFHRCRVNQSSLLTESKIPHYRWGHHAYAIERPVQWVDAESQLHRCGQARQPFAENGNYEGRLWLWGIVWVLEKILCFVYGAWNYRYRVSDEQRMQDGLILGPKKYFANSLVESGRLAALQKTSEKFTWQYWTADCKVL